MTLFIDCRPRLHLTDRSWTGVCTISAHDRGTALRFICEFKPSRAPPKHKNYKQVFGLRIFTVSFCCEPKNVRESNSHLVDFLFYNKTESDLEGINKRQKYFCFILRCKFNRVTIHIQISILYTPFHICFRILFIKVDSLKFSHIVVMSVPYI